MPRNLCECKKCGHVWMSRVENPDKCPACQSSLWNSDAQKNQYNFGVIEVGASMFYPWKNKPHENYKINAALVSFCHRTKRTFRRDAKGHGLNITRLT